jgi:hypothetical protein
VSKVPAIFSRFQQLASHWRFLLFLAFAAGVRLAFARDVFIGVQGDAVSYVQLAAAYMANGLEGLTTARPPAYPFVLGTFAKLFGLGVSDNWTATWLNLALDLLSIAFLLRIGRRVAGEAAAYGICFVALSPLWFGHVNCHVTEPMTVTCFLGFLDRWSIERRSERDEMCAGLWLGAMTLTRGMFLLFPLAVVLFEWLFRNAPRGYRIEGKRRLKFLAWGFALPVAWGTLNLIRYGEFTMTQTDTTAVLMAWLAIKIPTLDWHVESHAHFVKSHPWADVLMGNAPSARTQEVFKLMREEVIDFIKTHPFQYAWNFFPKALRLWVTGWWNPFSYLYSPRYLQSMYIWAFCLPVLFFGLVGVAGQWFAKGRLAASRAANAVSQWRATRAQALLVLYITGITLPFTVDARYSLPGYVGFAIWLGPGLLLFTKTAKSA